MATRKPDPFDIEIGQRIKIQRLTAGLSLAQLGESIGVTPKQVRHYESGVNRVGIARLTQIARVLNVSVSFLFAGRNIIDRVAQKGIEVPPSLLAHPFAFRLLQAYSTLTDDRLRHSIIELVEGIAWTFDGKNARRTRR